MNNTGIMDVFSLQTQIYCREQLLKRYNTLQVNPLLQEKLEAVMADVDVFNAHQFADFELEEIYTYLKTSHSYYLDVWIPKIENTLYQLQLNLGTYRSVNLLSLSLMAYKQELITHIEQEEKLLFVFVEKLLQGKECEGLKDLVLNHFIHTHDDNVIIEILQLKKEVLAIDNELKGNLILEVLFNQLELFQRDLTVHGLIEDEVFVQKVVEASNR